MTDAAHGSRGSTDGDDGSRGTTDGDDGSRGTTDANGGSRGPTDADVVVVGAGVVGCATARHLAEGGHDVLLLERGDFPTPAATSYGRSRIFRLAYHEGERYVPLLERSLAEWRALDDAADGDCLRPTGSLTVGPEGGESFEGALATCRAHGIDHEVLAAEAVNERFPAYDLPAGYRAVYQPDGCLLDAERCLTALAHAALDAGATLRTHEPVTDWVADGGTVRVETAATTYTAGGLVVASGAWAAEGIDALDGVLERERHVACRVLARERSRFVPGSFPAFVLDTADGRHFYGLPEHRVPGFKVGATHVDGASVGPEAAPDPDPEEADPVREFVREFLPAGDGGVVGLWSCVLSHSPDGDYVIDRLPDAENVVVAVGMSGHGFKTAPAVGAIAGSMAVGDPVPFDADGFALDRFEEG